MKVTTTDTLVHDLRESLRQRGITVRTWGQFVDAVESLGVKRADALGGVEFGMALNGTGRITASWEDDEWLIVEVL